MIQATTSNIDPGWSDMDRKLTVSFLIHDGTVVVTVEGPIDPYTADRFEKALISSVDIAEDSVVVDIGQVTLFGAAAISSLIRAQRTARAKDVRIRLRHPQPMARRVLRLTGTDEVFPVEDPGPMSTDEAGSADRDGGVSPPTPGA